MADPKLAVTEKVGYALGDMATNFVFQMMIMFQLAYYTDSFGITTATAATLLILVRFWDAIFDPVMGVIADRTSTRWGKFRPWILWTAVPFGVLSFLTFASPNLGSGGRLAYAFITYAGLMMVYSANNLPYSALSGVMTSDRGERISLSSYRFVFAVTAQLLVQAFALPMIQHFGAGNSPKGYRITMAIFSAFSVVLFLVTFSTTRERIRANAGTPWPVRRDLMDLRNNRPWRAIFFLTVILFATLSMRGAVVFYYFKYFVGNQGLFSAFNVAGTAVSIVGIVFSKTLAMRFGKRDVFIAGILLTALFTGSFVLLPPSAITGMFVVEMLRQFAYGLTIPLLWAMMADVADYSEWRNCRRATGMVFSANVFGLKAGLGLGSAITGYVLNAFGYIPNAPQTIRSLQGIRLAMSLFPSVTFALCAICLLFYGIDKNIELRVNEELASRRIGPGFQSTAVA